MPKGTLSLVHCSACLDPNSGAIPRFTDEKIEADFRAHGVELDLSDTHVMSLVRRRLSGQTQALLQFRLSRLVSKSWRSLPRGKFRLLSSSAG